VPGQINRHFLFLTSRQAAEPEPEDLLFANSRPSWRLVSPNNSETQHPSLELNWCRDRCRTFLEYGPKCDDVKHCDSDKHGYFCSINFMAQRRTKTANSVPVVRR